jgi:hypothetical protein
MTAQDARAARATSGMAAMKASLAAFHAKPRFANLSTTNASNDDPKNDADRWQYCLWINWNHYPRLSFLSGTLWQ